MKIWITKYALTRGIIEREGRLCERTDGQPSTMVKTDMGYYHAPDWHESKAVAVERARVMRDEKVGSVGRTLKKLAALDFHV
jgi:hypothetical protein